MWSSKLWGISLFVGFYWMLVLRSTGLTLSFAVYAGIVADLEGVLISVLLPRWQRRTVSVSRNDTSPT